MFGWYTSMQTADTERDKRVRNTKTYLLHAIWGVNIKSPLIRQSHSRLQYSFYFCLWIGLDMFYFCFVLFCWKCEVDYLITTVRRGPVVQWIRFRFRCIVEPDASPSPIAIQLMIAPETHLQRNCTCYYHRIYDETNSSKRWNYEEENYLFILFGRCVQIHFPLRNCALRKRRYDLEMSAESEQVELWRDRPYIHTYPSVHDLGWFLFVESGISFLFRALKEKTRRLSWNQRNAATCGWNLGADQ